MQIIRKLTAFLCSLALLCSLLPVTALAADVTYERSAQIGRGLILNTLRQKKVNGGARQMAVLDYTPGQGISPIVTYGSKVYGKSTVNAAIEYAQSKGYTVMAAINADYFNMSSGVPTGMLIHQGRLLVSDGAWNAVAFFTDGTAMVGTPRLDMRMTRSSTGQSLPIYALNKVRTNAGIYLYSEDFSANTHTTNPGTEVLLEVQEGDYLALGRPLTLRVLSTTHTTSTPLGPRQFVLSLTAENTAGLSLTDLVPGEEITILATTQDPRWHGAYYSSGGGNMLVRDGAVTSAATGGADPRTVLGVRPDGSMVVLACDGRQKGISDGMTLAEAAQYLLGLGCTNVVNLDGGGSTSASARYAGETGISLLTSPSEGQLRQCANFILFVNTGDIHGPETGISVYPKDPLLLAGASMDFTALSYNEDYFPGQAYPDAFAVTQGEGTIVGSTYTAPDRAGRAFVDAEVLDLQSDGTWITVVEQAASFSLVRKGSIAPITTLAAATGEQVDLDAYLSDGMRQIICQDTQFTFTISGPIGEIDETGLFTAAAIPGMSGSITAAYGETMSLTIPVTVGRAPQVLETFEGTPVYTALPLLETSSAQAVVSHAPENARYGVGSLYLSYTAQDTAEITRYTAAAPLKLSGGANIISMMAKGQGDFSVDFATPAGLVSKQLTLSDSWSYLTVDVPNGATAIAGFSAAAGVQLHGEMYVDQIMCHYGTATFDGQAPQISDLSFDGLTFTATLLDDYPLPLTQSMITLSLDGQPLPFVYEPQSGLVTASLTEPLTGYHRITVTAADFFLNTARDSIEYGQTETHSFTDLDQHWAADYAEYLLTTGVFAADTAFNPQNQVTNAMAATIISRYLGIDTTQYDSVELPYYDLFNVPEWALPHVKAMYAMNIMVGSFDGVNRVFYAQKPASRAQIMTILGRTIPRGYTYEKAAFDDYAQIPAWAADHISLLASLGIVSGYGGKNEVRAQNTITRAEVASLLFKLY